MATLIERALDVRMHKFAREDVFLMLKGHVFYVTSVVGFVEMFFNSDF